MPWNSPFVPRKIAIPTTGRNSPTAPAARMFGPSVPPSMSFSRRIGSNVPSAVVVIPSATGTKASTKPVQARKPVTTVATANVTNHPSKASRPAC